MMIFFLKSHKYLFFFSKQYSCIKSFVIQNFQLKKENIHHWSKALSPNFSRKLIVRIVDRDKAANVTIFRLKTNPLTQVSLKLLSYVMYTSVNPFPNDKV